MSGHWAMQRMRFRVTVANKEVNAVAAQVRALSGGEIVRIGPSFYCDDDASAMRLVMLTHVPKVEERPPD